MCNPRFLFSIGCMLFFSAAQAQTQAQPQAPATAQTPAPASGVLPSPVIDPLRNDLAARPPKPANNQLLPKAADTPSPDNRSDIQSHVEKQKNCGSPSLIPDVNRKYDCDPFPPDKRFVRPVIRQ